MSLVPSHAALHATLENHDDLLGALRTCVSRRFFSARHCNHQHYHNCFIHKSEYKMYQVSQSRAVSSARVRTIGFRAFFSAWYVALPIAEFAYFWWRASACMPVCTHVMAQTLGMRHAFYFLKASCPGLFHAPLAERLNVDTAEM
jgi:hypothetical protein